VNFALILFVLLVVTGVLAWIDRQFFAKARRARLAAAVAAAETGLTRGGGETEREFEARRAKARDDAARANAEPWWSEYSKSFFPVILAVFLLRSFLVEPFKIPSGSMLPTLLVGDFILVNKFTYGIRLPIVNLKVVELGSPQRGDVMVFRYPRDESVDYIKRVIGLPGDKVAWVGKRLFINDREVATKPAGEFVHRERYQVTRQYAETIDGREHLMLIEQDAPPVLPFVEQFPHRENCTYTAEGVTCTVPAGHYFMMGDNRDNSQDSRVWGFVPDRNIVGRAFFIWFNFSDLGRIGGFR
jgi:signal peptidase I